jgi:hypothetical protein
MPMVALRSRPAPEGERNVSADEVGVTGLLHAGADERPRRGRSNRVDTIRLPAVCDVQCVEDAFAELASNSRRHLAALYIDFQECRELDTTSLLYIVAVTAQRRRVGWTTRFRLPLDPIARAFLRWWRFPIAVARVAKLPFRSLIDGDDYHNEGGTPQLTARTHDPGAAILAYLIESRFFSFRSYRIGHQRESAEMVETEWYRWRNPLVMRLLERQLAGRATDVARVIIHELLANAIQHPRADNLTLVSYLGQPKVDPWPAERALTIAIWDNGLAIHETLRQWLNRGLPIRASETAIRDTFNVDARGWTPATTTYDSAWTPSASAQDAELLLASIFPGISQKAALPTPDVGSRQDLPDQPRHHSRYNSGIGHGLHALYRSVIDNFHGSIEFRADNLHLRLYRSEGRRGAYDATLSVARGPQAFRGNMVVIRLPTEG